MSSPILTRREGQLAQKRESSPASDQEQRPKHQSKRRAVVDGARIFSLSLPPINPVADDKDRRASEGPDPGEDTTEDLEEDALEQDGATPDDDQEDEDQEDEDQEEASGAENEGAEDGQEAGEDEAPSEDKDEDVEGDDAPVVKCSPRAYFCSCPCARTETEARIRSEASP
jgi:hypothetical protein